ncbi:MAG TPA: bifunctional phosphoribosylaminoimidazolecarboxamide formyltransferase/IMP cyclohydrolase [Stellaceae bacterium]|nr:bifunctional phosphoribosylaminoimidazolecarboxamide formyltransferase/IMP cyclohydrolase [Stellaceae bacterium]
MPEESLRPITRALLSTSDKTGLVAFAEALAARGVELVSTGGTAKALAAAGLKVIEVAELTGFPEMLDGRVKTLHPAIHGGLLARRDDAQHMAALARHGIGVIDLLVVTLYPFEATVARGASYEECIENIDIGGPALIRAAAKNHADVVVVTDPGDYDEVLAEITANNGATRLALRGKLASLAYARTAAYDAAISRWFFAEQNTTFPPLITFSGKLKQVLRYGENPHQQAAFYVGGDERPGIATGRGQVQGKELSFNNLSDTDAAFELVAEFENLDPKPPAVAIVKHANPCGAAIAKTLREAFVKALACDPVSAYGGIIAVNYALDEATAEEIVKRFAEVVIAPALKPAAKPVLARRPSLRVLTAGQTPDPEAPGLTIRSLAGGFLLQTRDNGRIDTAHLRTVTKRAPTPQELADLLFAFRVAKHVKSNAIVYAKNGATVGIGAGQMSRVDSARIAAWKAEEAGKAAGLAESPARGSVVASDAFFPFADGLEAAVAAGATAVIQPGGSVRDEEVIAAADKAGIAMVFTGIRHFRH